MHGVFRLNVAQGWGRPNYALPRAAAKIILASEEGVGVKVAGLPSGPYRIPVHLVDVQLQDDRPHVVCYTDTPVLETEAEWDEAEYVVLDL